MPKKNPKINKQGQYWPIVLKNCGGDEKKAEKLILTSMKNPFEGIAAWNKKGKK
jgi:hypothetical protein